MKYDQGTDRLTTDDDSCSADGATRSLPNIIVQDPPASTFSTPLGVDKSKCGGAHGTDLFVMFYAKGTATGGQVTLYSPGLDKTREVTVSSLTSRVEAP